MQDKYNHAEIEKSAQDHWQATDAYKAVEHAQDQHGNDKKKFYATTC